MPLPAILLDRSGFFSPRYKLNKLAEPIPINKAMANAIVVSGNATLVAALPKKPTP
mgnify:CR=1 FL=1